MTSLPDPFASFLVAFRHFLYEQDTSQHTANAYLADVRRFIIWYTQKTQESDLAYVTPTDIRAYREALQEQTPPLSTSTVNRRLVALRCFFSWAKEQQVLSASPTERIRNVETISHGPQSLDGKQWRRLLRCVEQAKGEQGMRDRCLILSLYYTEDYELGS